MILAEMKIDFNDNLKRKKTIRKPEWNLNANYTWKSKITNKDQNRTLIELYKTGT